MSSREKDQADFDLERFVELFDECMTSENPAVQKAFKNLLLVASISHSDTKRFPVTKGPLRRLVEDLHHINRRVGQLEDRMLREAPSRNEIDIEKMSALQQAQIAPMYVSPQVLEKIKRNKDD